MRTLAVSPRLGGANLSGDYSTRTSTHYSVEYTFGDGTKMFLEGRNSTAASRNSPATSTAQGLRVISSNSHSPARCRIYKGRSSPQRPRLGRSPSGPDPYQVEWDDLIHAIRR